MSSELEKKPPQFDESWNQAWARANSKLPKGALERRIAEANRNSWRYISSSTRARKRGRYKPG